MGLSLVIAFSPVSQVDSLVRCVLFLYWLTSRSGTVVTNQFASWYDTVVSTPFASWYGGKVDMGVFMWWVFGYLYQNIISPSTTVLTTPTLSSFAPLDTP